jgi:Pregnancy-associated plasma protein-A
LINQSLNFQLVMKNLILLLAIIVLACNKKEKVVPQNIKISTLKLNISKPAGTFWRGESDALTFAVDVVDEAGKTYTNYAGAVSYFANDQLITGNKFEFSTEGTIVFSAKIETKTSEKSANYVVKNPEKELAKLEVTNGFYNTYVVNHALIGSNPNISIKGISKDGTEIPLSKGAKITTGGQLIALQNYTFNQLGKQNIAINAYGKTAEVNYTIRANNRAFDLVRIPLMFHFCKPGPFINPSVSISDEQYLVQAIAQLKSGEIINQLNAMYRNKFIANANAIDPNAADTFIEFYLAETGPDGKSLAEKGVNRLLFTKPYAAPSQNYDKNSEAAKQFETALANELSKYNLNAYLNIVVEPFGGWGYAGIGKQPFSDNTRKAFIPKEYFDLPISGASDALLFKDSPTTQFYDHIRMNGSKNILTASDGFVDKGLLLNTNLAHEIGHVLGLPHTFWRTGDCNIAQHSDGLFDTPMHSEPNYNKSCDGILFPQRNMMNYMDTPQKGYFTYDQATLMRARIEAQFNIPSPRNKGKSSGRIMDRNQNIISIID